MRGVNAVSVIKDDEGERRARIEIILDNLRVKAEDSAHGSAELRFREIRGKANDRSANPGAVRLAPKRNDD